MVQRRCHEGFAGAQDYSQCYDMMHPEVVASAMASAGIPKKITQVLETMWTQQTGWMTSAGDTAEESLQEVEAIPQGGPWGPLALNIYMSAGYSWVTEEIETMRTERKREEEGQEHNKGTEGKEDKEAMTKQDKQKRRRRSCTRSI